MSISQEQDNGLLHCVTKSLNLHTNVAMAQRSHFPQAELMHISQAARLFEDAISPFQP